MADERLIDEVLAGYATGNESRRREIGRQLRAWRRQKGFRTQKDLAEATEIGVATIHRIENGKNVESNSLARLRAALDPTIEVTFEVNGVQQDPATIALTPEQREAHQVADLWLQIDDSDARAQVRGLIESYLKMQAASTAASSRSDAGTTPGTPPATGKQRAR